MTIKDIAVQCGVSITTVSRVINGHPYVSDKVRKKVNRVIEENHFVLHEAAADLVKHKTDAIGIVVRGTGNPFFSELTPQIEQVSGDLGYTVYKDYIHSDEDEVMTAAKLVKNRRLKGVILEGGRFDYTKEQADIIGVPFVCCTFSNNFGTLSADEYSSVSIDDVNESCRAVQYLIENGHRRIAILVDTIKGRSVGELRYKGYVKALEEAGIPFDPELVIETSAFQMNLAYESMSELIDSGKEFTAVFAASDSMAMGAVKAMADKGKKVPDDYSVMGIDGIEVTNFMIPTLTTIRQPAEDIAGHAVRMLHGVIDGSGSNDQILVEALLRQGGSVRNINTQ